MSGTSGVQPVQATIELFDAFTAPMMQIINAANLGASAITAMQNVVNANIDPSSVQQMEQSIQDAQAAAERFRESLRGMEMPENTAPAVPEPVQVPFQWQRADNIEVFNTSGTERWRQEIASAQEMMNRLASTQERIAHQAVYGYIMPPDAANDMTALNQRITAIGQRIQQISARPLNTVSERDIAETEQLRMQLNRCLQLQNQMNTAADALDLEAANRAYLQLEQTVGNTERFIRDNISEQRNFNNAVRSGQNEADKLTGFIKKAAGAFLSIKGIQKIVEVSDEMTSVTARLDNMNQAFNKVNNTAVETDSIVNLVYQAAEDARGSFSDMAAVVAKFGNNARDAFSSQQEVVDFATLIQKQMTIAGASTEEASNAMLQLSQALGSGVLRGDELNSIFEQAPNIIQSIADYLDKPIGKIREMASNGEITAAVVKAAIFESADDINAKFDKMPKTWGQVWQSMKNQSIMAMQPVLDKISEMASMEEVQEGISAIMDIIATTAGFAVEVLGIVAEAGAFVVDNWDVLAPIFLAAATALGVYSVALAVHKAAVNAATLAQQGFNIALNAKYALGAAAAVLAFVAAIGLYTKGVNDAYGLSLSFAGMLGGSVMTVLATLGNLFIGVANKIIMAFDFIWNTVAAFVNYFANVWENPIGAVWNLWKDLFTNATDVLLNITEMIDTLFKTDFSDKLTAFRDDMISRVESTYGEEMKKANVTVMDKRHDRLDYIDLDEAFEAGYYLGDSLVGGENSFSANQKSGELSEIYSAIDSIAGNTESINDTLSVSEEDLKYLRDIAEQETVNRFTTAEITIEQTNHNTISGDMDIDGIVEKLTTAVGEAASIISEGAYA